jgi:hypothetical protein
MLYHVVLFTLRADAQSELAGLVEELRALAALPMVEALAAGVRHEQTGHDAALIVQVADAAQLRAYREHPEHQPVLARLRELAAVVEVADFESPDRLLQSDPSPL